MDKNGLRELSYYDIPDINEWIRKDTIRESKVGEGRMVFIGISKVFSTKDDRQYETIGAFWDEFSKKYGRAI